MLDVRRSSGKTVNMERFFRDFVFIFDRAIIATVNVLSMVCSSESKTVES